MILLYFSSSGIGETLRQCLKDLTQTERCLDQHWRDVEANALRAQTGQTFKLRVSTFLLSSVEAFMVSERVISLDETMFVLLQ